MGTKPSLGEQRPTAFAFLAGVLMVCNAARKPASYRGANAAMSRGDALGTCRSGSGRAVDIFGRTAPRNRREQDDGACTHLQSICNDRQGALANGRAAAAPRKCRSRERMSRRLPRLAQQGPAGAGCLWWQSRAYLSKRNSGRLGVSVLKGLSVHRVDYKAGLAKARNPILPPQTICRGNDA